MPNTGENMRNPTSNKSASRETWDRKYDTEEYVYGRSPNDFLATHYTTIPKGKVLCLADGEGRNSVFLAKQGYQVTAVDVSPVGLEKARRLAREEEVDLELICADLSTYNLGEARWDGIVSIYCHLPPPLRKALHQQVMHALTPQGVFLLEAYRPKQLEYGTGGPPIAALMITMNSLVTELPDLHFHHLVQLDRVLQEGRNHSGIGAVVQAIATKKK